MKMMLKATLTAALAALAIAPAAPLLAQAVPASVHGHVNDATGAAMSGAQAKFTTDKTSENKDRKFPYSFDTDANGDYKATGLPPGDYLVVIFKGTVQADFQLITLKAGDDKTLNFDMTREEYLKSMTPEQRQQIEDLKKKNAAANSANTVIARLNATLKTVRADLTAAAPTKADVAADIASMKEAVDAKPELALLWFTYGDALLAEGDHLTAEDKKAGKPAMSDDEVLKSYGDAASAYQKAIDLDKASSKPNVAELAASYNQLGTALSRSGKGGDAAKAFDGAAATDPPKASMYFKNEAVVLYNANLDDDALAAADKAIAADPKNSDAYWIKGQVLIKKSAFDNKTQKIVPPPGCVDAYNKFLELAPDDPKAPAVREVLTGLGEKIDTKFKAGKK